MLGVKDRPRSAHPEQLNRNPKETPACMRRAFAGKRREGWRRCYKHPHDGGKAFSGEAWGRPDSGRKSICRVPTHDDL